MTAPAPSRLLAALAFALAAQACAPAPAPDERVSSPVIYGSDDRRELFEVEPALRDAVAASVVALLPRSAVARDSSGRVAITAPTWGEAGNLCPGERFADQPAAAFCSGVLVDEDLVLTADHCTRLFALSDFVVVLGYGETESGRIDARPEDVLDVREIVTERLDPMGVEPRLDYAWLRLTHRVSAPRRPAALRLSPSALSSGTPIVAASAANGVPIKVDAGGHVTDGREATLDYFVCDTDTSHGSSGAPAFDPAGAVAGILARGDGDLQTTAAGCETTVLEPSSAANEQFTYTRWAVEGLCAADPAASSVCRPECGSPCLALAAAPEVEGGCSLGAGGGVPGPSAWLTLLPFLALLRRNRVQRRDEASLAQALG